MTNYRIIVSVHDGPPCLRPSGRCLLEMAGCHIEALVLPGYYFKIWLGIGLPINNRLDELRGGTIKLVLTVNSFRSIKIKTEGLRILCFSFLFYWRKAKY